MALKIQYCSDLHLEFRENNAILKRNLIPPMGQVLILGGDIMLFSEMHRNQDFFNYVSDNFETTYWIPGNHEYYHSS
ncbi:metallophosphoesterase [Flavipsychrobacter stenotrophus]|uniref:metallophosphoesterase n=1 Tax=Flavipsychrobacter stenotrophus TaxID=2077091 RepID=UPI00196A724C|nr:metallophosphoesterase [Flavipsychrobacter stenotrophus]